MNRRSFLRGSLASAAVAIISPASLGTAFERTVVPTSVLTADQLSAIVRYYILPQVTENIYARNNALLYRLIQAHERD